MTAVPPRFRNVPPAHASAGREAVDLARIVGLDLSPWQELFLEDALAERPDGLFAAKQVALNVPRQNGKGNVIVARILYGALLGGDQLITLTAHQFDTAQEMFLRLCTLFDSCDFLRDKLKRIRTANGSEGVELTNGARVNVKARSKGKGRGFSGDLVILDEAMILSDGMLDGLVPTMSTRPNPQLWLVGSAPVIGPESDIWRGIITAARKGGTGTCYAEWSCPVGADTRDPESLAMSNPGLGTTVSSEFVDEVERLTLTEDGLARERFGIWNPDEAKPSAIPKLDFAACADPMAAPQGVISFGLTVVRTADADDRTTASISVCGDWVGHNCVELIDHRDRQSEAWIVPRLLELTTAHEYRHVAIDSRSPAASLIPALEAAGVRVLKVETKDAITASAGIFDEILDHTLRHNGEPVLAAAAASVVKRDVWGAWVWSFQPGTVTSPFLAAVLARWGHLTAPETPAPVAIGAFYR